MRPFHLLLVVVLTSALAAGCGQSVAPTPVQRPAPVVAQPAAAPVLAQPQAAPVVAKAAEVPLTAAAPAMAAADPAPVVITAPRLEDEQDDPADFAEAAVLDVVDSTSTDTTTPQLIPWVDARTPTAVSVVQRSAHSATIYWFTQEPTAGRIEYGRAWGFRKNGYTQTYEDKVPKQQHQITIMNLRRFTKYRFRVSAVTSLSLVLPEKHREFRTKFWSWR